MLLEVDGQDSTEGTFTQPPLESPRRLCPARNPSSRSPLHPNTATGTTSAEGRCRFQRCTHDSPPGKEDRQLAMACWVPIRQLSGPSLVAARSLNACSAHASWLRPPADCMRTADVRRSPTSAPSHVLMDARCASQVLRIAIPGRDAARHHLGVGHGPTDPDGPTIERRRNRGREVSHHQCDRSLALLTPESPDDLLDRRIGGPGLGDSVEQAAALESGTDLLGNDVGQQPTTDCVGEKLEERRVVQ